MSIITISRTMGSQGDLIARTLAEELGWYCLDKQELEKIRQQDHLTDIPAEHFDEHAPDLKDHFTRGKEQYLHFLQSAVFDTAGKENAIIIGRGGQFLLKDLPGVLHIRIIAGQTTRVNRLMTALECTEKQALHLMENSDHQRSGFHKFFFNQDWNTPEAYDMILNTSVLKEDSCVTLIQQSLKTPEWHLLEEETRSKLEDMALAHKVFSRVLYREKIPVDLFHVECHEGILTLQGAVVSIENIERVKDCARTMKGVKGIKSELYFVPPYMGG